MVAATDRGNESSEWDTRQRSGGVAEKGHERRAWSSVVTLRGIRGRAWVPVRAQIRSGRDAADGDWAAAGSLCFGYTRAGGGWMDVHASPPSRTWCLQCRGKGTKTCSLPTLYLARARQAAVPRAVIARRAHCQTRSLRGGGGRSGVGGLARAMAASAHRQWPRPRNRGSGRVSLSPALEAGRRGEEVGVLRHRWPRACPAEHAMGADAISTWCGSSSWSDGGCVDASRRSCTIESVRCSADAERRAASL